MSTDSPKVNLWRTLMALVLFLHLPLFFLRLLLGMAVNQDEKLRIDECQDLLKREMQAYLIESAPRVQLQEALNRIIRDMPVESERGLTRRWAEEFRSRFKKEIPCKTRDFWIFGKDFEPLVIDGTPSYMAEKARYFWAYMCEIWAFTGGPAKHEVEAFLQTLSHNQGLSGFKADRFVEFVSRGEEADKIMDIKSFTRMWSESVGPVYLRRKFKEPSPLDRPRIANPSELILTTSGRTHFLFLRFADPISQRPLGGFLITIPEKSLSMPWVLKAASRKSRFAGCRRVAVPADPKRKERVFETTRKGFLFCDWPLNHPEFHLGVILPLSWAQHPARRYLTLLNIIMGAVFLLTLFFLKEIARWEDEMPLRIYGQLNLALSLSALLPLVGFLLVAWSYASFHYSQERRMTAASVAERMQFVDAELRGYREKLIRHYRFYRDRIQAEYLDRIEEAVPFLMLSRKRNHASDFVLRLTNGRFFSSFFGKDPLVEFANAIPKRLLTALPIEQSDAGGSGAQMREGFKDEIIMTAIEQNMPDLMTSIDKQFMLSVSSRENTVIYLDYLTDPRREKSIVGVLAFFLSTDKFMDVFFREEFFKKSDARKSLGFDSIKVIKIDLDNLNVHPAGAVLEPRERELFELCRNTGKPTVWDDIETVRPGFLGAQFVGNEPYVMIVRRDGSDIVRNHKILIAGIAFGALYALIVFVLITRFLALRFAEPLLKLRGAAESVEQLNYTTRVEIPGRDEFGELAGVFNRMVKGLHERQQMSRFVSGDVLEAVTSGGGATQEAVRTNVSVLFSDIRGFTELSERFDAAEIVRMLNAYFTAMEACIVDQGGRIDKLVGDAIMAVFRDLPDREPHPLRCARAALAMREALRGFNRERQFAGLFTVSSGIGINTGEVISGPLGSLSGRLDYTVIGDTVNIAARLEKESKRAEQTQTIVSPSTLSAIGPRARVSPLGEVSLKGKEKLLMIYELLEIREVI